MQFPDPPALAKLDRGIEDINALAAQLYWSGLLSKDWDESKHPRTGAPPNSGWFAEVPKEQKLPAAGGRHGQEMP